MHHIVPLHMLKALIQSGEINKSDPNFELAACNFMLLCKQHHHTVGHDGNWLSVNTDACKDGRCSITESAYEKATLTRKGQWMCKNKVLTLLERVRKEPKPKNFPSSVLWRHEYDLEGSAPTRTRHRA